jgi:predicted nucleic acid-binding protein
VEDVLSGATALAHELTLATRNLNAPELDCGLSVESWWV